MVKSGLTELTIYLTYPRTPSTQLWPRPRGNHLLPETVITLNKKSWIKNNEPHQEIKNYLIKIISGNDTVASSDSGFTSPSRTTPSTTPVGTVEKYRLEKGLGRPSLLVKHSSVVRTMQNLSQAQNQSQEALTLQSHRVQSQNREEKEKRRVRHNGFQIL